MAIYLKSVLGVQVEVEIIEGDIEGGDCSVRAKEGGWTGRRDLSDLRADGGMREIYDACKKVQIEAETWPGQEAIPFAIGDNIALYLIQYRYPGQPWKFLYNQGFSDIHGVHLPGCDLHSAQRAKSVYESSDAQGKYRIVLMAATISFEVVAEEGVL